MQDILKGQTSMSTAVISRALLKLIQLKKHIDIFGNQQGQRRSRYC